MFAKALHVSPAPQVFPNSFSRIPPRACRVCGRVFRGLGSLCPVHLAIELKVQALEAKRGDAITRAREQKAHARRKPITRMEWKEEID